MKSLLSILPTQGASPRLPGYPRLANHKSLIINHKRLTSSLLLLLASSCLAPAADLLSSNPFIPEGWVAPSDRAAQAAIAPPPPVNLEFKGLDDWNGTISFYLYDKVKQSGRWVVLNDESVDTPVVSFDQGGENVSISVRINGKIEKMTMKKPDGKPLEVATFAPAPAPAAAPGQPPAVGPNGQPIPPAPIRRRVILPGAAPDQNGAPQIDASDPKNNAVLSIVNQANTQVQPAAPATPPPAK